MRRWRRWGLALLVLLPALTVAAQGFRGRRRAPGNDPNPNVPYDGRFTFVRMRFEPLGGGWDLKWDHDYPRAEMHFMKILEELTTVKPFLEGSNILAFDDPALFKYPVAYVSEPGYWSMNEQELAGLKAYVQKGGFLIFDDFAGTPQFRNFEFRWMQAFPGMTLVKLDRSHPLFDSFYHIESLDMDHPYYGAKAEFWGAFEDNDPAKRLVMIANFNNDIGDYMEWSDEGFLPIALSNEAYKLAVNYVVYAMTH
ncbi:MAG TPA: DUF4159 domain-containing protein [Gemmatimonadaceae bacterium]|jgi:hypothetical protein|nr:DUF4159 domain-containing protein [Gemmatimonadaceae bacterium]HPV75361.1 DUF4159 domain-containing protein [Gemmatimonadaceae bacterium]